jgi:hypothetical protein
MEVEQGRVPSLQAAPGLGFIQRTEAIMLAFWLAFFAVVAGVILASLGVWKWVARAEEKEHAGSHP